MGTETINLWGGAGILLFLTCLYAGLGVWAARRQWEYQPSDWKASLIWLSFAFWGSALIGLWATWIYRLVVSPLVG